jgi:hypothetical protein
MITSAWRIYSIYPEECGQPVSLSGELSVITWPTHSVHFSISDGLGVTVKVEADVTTGSH